ncbi:ATPase [Natrialba magadii ATCC 43099]|uniref:ATPase n=1 Tax=Natrialba magadii (strain ATCC 43099 / DSM 3394 / CCM 3739 / CIP 104546 / IAM 13178 / JCM 8861 / NBRC 102185 / NCIMB 2190 / MS3) TaxID=547559 RepID=L9V9U1_NATMM|nr:ATPase [Natrialba magadii ATCC 43099]
MSQAVQQASFPVDCSRVGRWWYKEAEIDIVGLDPQTETLLLGECKWTTTPVGPSLLAALEALEEDVRWKGADRTVVYALFSHSGFSAELRQLADDRSDLSLYTPPDLATIFAFA